MVWLTAIYGFITKYKHQEVVNKNNRGEKLPPEVNQTSAIYPWKLEPKGAPVLVSRPFLLQVKAGAWPCPSVLERPWLTCGMKPSSHACCGGQQCAEREPSSPYVTIMYM